MLWELTWVPRKGCVQVVETCDSRPDAMLCAEVLLGGHRGWREVEDDLWVCKVRDSPIDLGGGPGELVISRLGPSSEEVAAMWPRPDNQVDGEDLEFTERIDILIEAIRRGQFLAFRYTTKKKADYPGLIQPNGWRIFSHTHPFRGGETICVVGYCFYYHEERWYAVKKMHELRCLDSPEEELRKLGWPRSSPAESRLSHASSIYSVGETVYHPVFGVGTVSDCDRDGRHIWVDFPSRTAVELSLPWAPVFRISRESRTSRTTGRDVS